MELWLWMLIGILEGGIVVLSIKIYCLRTSIQEIERGLIDRLDHDTNILIDVSSQDQFIRSLATTLNRQLKILRQKSIQYQNGEREVQNAISSLSHDIRTPMTAIYGYIELLEKQENSSASKRYLAIIKKRMEILAQLAEELFQYSVSASSTIKMKKEPVLINSALEESIAAFYGTLIDRKITPNIQICETKVIRMLDRSSLSRIFSNLLNNAIKYSEGDLTIVLTEQGEIIFSNRTNALDPIQVGKLFDRFYTVDTAQKSTGLGLAIVKNLVEKMEGKIDAVYKNGILSIMIVFDEEKTKKILNQGISQGRVETKQTDLEIL